MFSFMVDPYYSTQKNGMGVLLDTSQPALRIFGLELTIVTAEKTSPVANPTETNDQRQVRMDKRAALLARGEEAYPVGVARTHSLHEIREQFPELAPDTATGVTVGIVGRIVFMRNTGKLCFATLQEGGPEGTGTRLQAMLSLANVGEETLADWKSLVDLGDHVLITGEVISSRRGELSVMAD